MPRNPAICPVCGEDVPLNARACPECGACHKSGWNDKEADGLGLPDEEGEFDYDKFLQEEFGQGARPKGLPWIWWVVALAVLFAFMAMSLHTFVRH